VFRCHGYYENNFILVTVSASHLLGPCTYERKEYISLTFSLSLAPREKCILFGSSTKRLREKQDATEGRQADRVLVWISQQLRT
jgi:hypothetical protein